MNYKLFSLMMLLFTNITVCADQDKDPFADFNQHALVISLGSSCEIANQLYALGLRVRTFPFDWALAIDESRFIELIENDFEYFLDEKYLGLHNNSFVHTYYHIEFRHDAASFGQFFAKYQRRITRFRLLDRYPGKVFFVRSSYSEATNKTIWLYWPNEEALKISNESALKLNTALKKLFPNLDFTLLIVNPGNIDEIQTIDDVVIVNYEPSTRLEQLRKLLQTLGNFPNEPLPWH